jgi:hypothetical protein
MPRAVRVVQVENCAFANIEEKTYVFTASIMEKLLAGEYLQTKYEGVSTF